MKDNEITEGIEIYDLALYIAKFKTLIIADFHLGYEEALNKQGVLIPHRQYLKTRERLERLFSILKKQKKEIKEIIINGDLKHEFGTISEQEWLDVLNVLAFLQKQCGNVSLIRGNHDTILGPIADKRNLKIVDEKILDSILILHGHEIPNKIEQDTIIIAHEHPCVTISDGVTHEKEKCFLCGQWENKLLIVQPSFNLITEGTDIKKEELLSPFLQRSLADFDVWVIADKPRYFGKLADLEP